MTIMTFGSSEEQPQLCEALPSPEEWLNKAADTFHCSPHLRTPLTLAGIPLAEHLR